VTATADILVAAVGRAGFVTPAFVRAGATVIDVGINRLSDRRAVEALFGPGSPKLADFEKRGAVVVGDVHPDVGRLAGALTPVPGGVGPLTVAVLIRNTLRAAERRLGFELTP
jgi:methylenetetrahydrofolate dehydrogenase (NADP+)/methenyltetrahydrofolate cyclohydrolase